MFCNFPDTKTAYAISLQLLAERAVAPEARITSSMLAFF